MKTKIGDITLVLHRDMVGRIWEYQGLGLWNRLFTIHFKSDKNRPNDEEETADFVERILSS